MQAPQKMLPLPLHVVEPEQPSADPRRRTRHADSGKDQGKEVDHQPFRHPEVQPSGYCKQHFLYFLPLPHGQGSLRPIFARRGDARTSSWVRSELGWGDQPAGRIV
ncbi:MAG: hypothetical protein QOJ58_2023 [Alphaproteobacteria bacterium]|nr:hypothetical protein [Alphaproteobacteria bacterium]